MNKKILVYFGDYKEKKDVIERILHDIKIPYKILEDYDLMENVGYLMNLEGFQKNHEQGALHYESDLMILNNIEDEEITTINQLMKALDISMERKAILTKHNQHWRVCDLLTEIEKEHQYFTYVDKIKQILIESSTLAHSEYTNHSWTFYENAFVNAYESISKESTLEEIVQCYHQLIKAKDELKKLVD